jgi:hypothetical protein
MRSYALRLCGCEKHLVRSHSKFLIYLTHFDSVANSGQRKIPTSFEKINTKNKMECEDADGSVNPDQDADLDRDETKSGPEQFFYSSSTQM